MENITRYMVSRKREITEVAESLKPTVSRVAHSAEKGKFTPNSGGLVPSFTVNDKNC